MDPAKNFAKVTVDGGYDDTDTSVDLLAGDGLRLPTVPFNAVWWNATDYPDPADDPGVEVVRVTAVSTDTLTITRAQEGTDANDKNVLGKTYKMDAGLTAFTMEEFRRTILPHADGVMIGDVLSNGNGTNLDINDTDEKILVSVGSVFAVNGPFGTDRATTGLTTLGTVIGKFPLYNPSGTLIGYLPIYDGIT